MKLIEVNDYDYGKMYINPNMVSRIRWSDRMSGYTEILLSGEQEPVIVAGTPDEVLAMLTPKRTYRYSSVEIKRKTE